MKQVKAMLLSAGVMAVSGVLLLALLALIFGKTGTLPKGAAPLITTVIGCAAVFLGGLTASLYSREKGMLMGLTSGALFVVCVALVSVIGYNNAFTIASVGKLAAVLLSGIIGGILGVNRKSRVKF